MEGEEEIFASIDSLWFYSSVFLPRPVEQTTCPPPRPGPGELQPKVQDSTVIHKMGGDCGNQDPGCVREAAAAVAGRRGAAAAARSKEVKEGMYIWQEQRRQMRVVAAVVRCSPLPMPHPSDGPAMKAHLRSWAHAVACSVR